MNWDLLTSAELGELDRNIPVIMCIAATEQHGPHLPLATDRIIGEHFLNCIEKDVPGKVLILPTISVGCSDHHLDFPGSLSVMQESLLNYAENVLNSVIHHGFKNIIIFNSHGGNQGIATVLYEKLGYAHQDCNIILSTWWKLAGKELLALNESGKGGTGHAGEFETSLLLHFTPELVRVDKIDSAEQYQTHDWNDGDMLYGSEASLYQTLKQRTPNGVFGRPSAGSADKGRKISELVSSRLKQIILELLEAK